MKKITKAELNRIVLEKYKNQYLKETGFPHLWVMNRIKQYRTNLERGKIVSNNPITFAEKYLNFNYKNKDILIVGLGLSILIVNYFLEKGANVYGIEPDKNRIDVQYLNAEIMKFNKLKLKRAKAEKIPFKSGVFDFVFCYTVLEHVENVEKALLEMYRVLKRNIGILFIGTSDFRIPYEPHYKIRFPSSFFGLIFLYTFLPANFQKAIMKIYLKLLRRPTKYLDTINFLNEKYLKKLFFKNNWNYFQLFFNVGSPSNSVFYKWRRFFNIQKNLWFYVLKH